MEIHEQNQLLIHNICNFLMFYLVNNNIGKPEVFLKTMIPEIESIDVSLSHCKEYAMASVVVLFK